MRQSILALVLAALVGGCGAGGGGSSASATSTAPTSSGPGPGPAPANPPPPPTGAAAIPTSDYVILAADGVVSELAPLIASYAAAGRTVAAVPLSRVQAAGRDRAEEIRAWLVQACNDGRRRDLLLVGGPADIPYRMVSPAPGVGRIASDLYYGDLTGEWDRDGDGAFAEIREDAPDFDAELRVGRIPYSDPADVAAAVRAIEAARAGSGAWTSRALVAGAIIQIPGDAALGCEMIAHGALQPAGWDVRRSYTAACPLPSDFTLGPGSVVARLATEPVALAFFVTHGSPLGLASNEPSGWIDVLDATELALLPRAEPPVIVAAACSTTEPSGGDGIGERALRDGVAGFIGASTIVNPLSGAGAGTLAQIEIAKKIAAGRPLGEALAETVRGYAAALAGASTDAEREDVWTEALSGMLFGDPGLAVGPNR